MLSTDFLEKSLPLVLVARSPGTRGNFSSRSQNAWFSGPGGLRPPDLPGTRRKFLKGDFSTKSVDDIVVAPPGLFRDAHGRGGPFSVSLTLRQDTPFTSPGPPLPTVARVLVGLP